MKPPAPVIGVIVPAYQAELTLGRTLRSLLAQEDPRWNATVVDDGSTDRTSEVVHSINDPRIHLVRTENRGVSVARNLGFSMSSEPLVCFLDADDTLDANYMRHMIPAATGQILGSSCGYRYLNSNQTEIHRVPAAPSDILSPDAMLRLDPPAIMSLVHNRKVLERVAARDHLFDPTLNSFEDWDLLRRIGGLMHGTWTPISRVLTSYQCTTGSLSSNAGQTLKTGCALLRLHGRDHPNLERRIREHQLRCLAASIMSEESGTTQSLRISLEPIAQVEIKIISNALRWHAMRRWGVPEGETAACLPEVCSLLERSLAESPWLPDLLSMLWAHAEDRWGHALKRVQEVADQDGRIVLLGLGRNGHRAVERAAADGIKCVVADDDPTRGCSVFPRIDMDEINTEDAVLVTPDDSACIVDRLRARGLTRLITLDP